MTLARLVKQKAFSLGFDLVGIVPAARSPHADTYASWVDAGYAATLEYMARDVGRRQDPRLVLPGARSVVTVGLSYFSGDPPSDIWDNVARGRIARYAWGPDYHDVMLPRLQQLGQYIQLQAGREAAWRAYVDTGPLLERDLAASAGLGFIGKNTCLISPEYGSYVFLGEVLVDIEMEYDTGEPKGTCGACVRCLNACPTGALVAPYVLDSRRCIAYLTIELKGAIPVDLRSQLGNWIFGCDVCQAVCPWTRRFAQSGRHGFLQYDPEGSAPHLLDLIGLNHEQFRARFRGSPVSRAKRRGLLRNVAVALAHWGDAAAAPVLRAAAEDADPIVREHARWALQQIG
jgi:epoxyqueuosine reductase